MIQIRDLRFSYGETPLYEKVSLIVGKGQKIGLVGPNGSGKSTLLKIITGREVGYSGRIEVSGSFGLVPQEVKHDPVMEVSSNVREYVDPDNIHQDFQIHKLFDGLELILKLDSDPKMLSGGQKTKLALARALLANPDILLLDEPTNFMDDAGKRFVMNFLSSYEGTVIVISHDLDLMNKAIDKVLSVNPQTKSIEEYKGNYSDFLRLKGERDELLRKQVLIKQKHIKQMEEGLRKMARFTSKKGVRARVRQQKRIEKEKTNLPELPAEVKKIKATLPEPANVGELLMRVNSISKSYGELEVLKNVNFSLLRGERLALIGPNGAGKSTLIKILMDILPSENGEVFKNPQLKIGYYSQEFEGFDFQKTVLDTFIDETRREEGFARSFLGRYMFLGDKAFQKIETLSGGEKTRLSIAILTGRDNNLLVLDEPTTYLDVVSQRVILESLKEYKGAMILVSHTPEFVKELAPQKAIIFPEQKLTLWDNELLDRVLEV